MPKRTITQPGQLDFWREPTDPPGKPEAPPRRPPAAPPVAAPPAQAAAPPHSRFETRFRAATRRDWEIHFTQNKSVMISYRSDSEPPILRIHEMFRDASHDVAEAVAQIVEGKRRAWPRLVNEYIRRHLPEYADTRPARRLSLETKGQAVDLKPLFDALNATYFNGTIDARLGWMTPRIQRRVSIKLGSYSEETNVIRIHPALDHPDVPLKVVEAILFHEMVHAHIKTTQVEGRRISHGTDFQRELARYPDTAFADEWIKSHLGMLLPQRRRRRNPSPPPTRRRNP